MLLRIKITKFLKLNLLILEKKSERDRFWNLNDNNKELLRNIRREVSKLSEKWNALIERSDQWLKKLENGHSVRSSFLLLFLINTKPLSRPRNFLPIFLIRNRCSTTSNLV